jgi:hypothetical protein
MTKTATKELTNDRAARQIARLTVRLTRQGRRDLADAIIRAAAQHLSIR